MIIVSNRLFTLSKENNPVVESTVNQDVVLLYISKGTAEVYIDQNKFLLSSNHSFIINPFNSSQIKKADISAELEIYLLYLNLYEVHSYLECPFCYFSNLEKHKPDEWHKVCQSIEEIIDYYENKARNNFIKLKETTFFCNLLNAMIPFLISKSDSFFDKAPAVMNEIFWYIQYHYTEELRLKDIADKFYVSLSSLSRWIKQYYGMNYEKYIRKLRTDSCALEISNTNKSITEISVKYGFSNPAALNKAFHEFYSTTPGQYRKMHHPHWQKDTIFHA